MNNLENPDILSDEIVEAIILIADKCPEVVFGGSIALNAVGLLNRKIGDIDVFFTDEHSFAINNGGFLAIPTTEILSDTVTDTNGKLIQRTGLKVNGIKTCAFKVNPEELQHSVLTFYRSTIGKTITLNIQNVNYAIAAKIAYHYKKEKHDIDLTEINNVFNDIFNESEQISDERTDICTNYNMCERCGNIYYHNRSYHKTSEKLLCPYCKSHPQSTSDQDLPSDKEIEDECSKRYYDPYEKQVWIQSAKWMREQIKSIIK
jgi:hypothetical protein